LVPIPDKIHILRDQIFATSGSLGPQTPGTAQEQMQAEKARIAIYDGCGDPSLLARTVDYLRSQGADTTQMGDAGQAYAYTTIIDHTGNPYTLKYLVDLMQISPNKIYIKYDPNSAADVEVYLGSDWARQENLP
jgi:hypothetical protein